MVAADWPTHDNKAWQAVLEKAHALGWPKPAWTSAHPKLVLKCPADNPSCTITAFSTGSNTERVAIQSLDRLDRCPHRDVTDEIAKVDVALDRAERFLDAASVLRERGVAGERMSELLELASSEVDIASEALEREFDDVSAQFEEHTARIAELTDTDPDRVSEAELARDASGSLREARKTLKGLPKRNSEAEERRARLDSLTKRLDGLR